VNLAQRFRAGFSGDPLALHAALRERAPGPFGAYLHLPFGQVASVSPERFLALRDGRVETRPIKGTRPRDPDPRIDAQLARELASSPKELAENVMIVDLLRNDLGRCARAGSVRVPRRFEIESFPSVHHLVSTVTAELAPGRDAFDLLRACFPGGSITGAPKLQAMRLIESLEPDRRGVYCGSIGYVGVDGAMDVSIAIRTATVREGQAEFWAGGGIVHDSVPAFEYAETLGKAQAFLALCPPALSSPAGRA
jgi:para-aminobenzoate synthetase component 1